MQLLTALGLLAQLAAPATHRLPVLSFPEAGMDDTAAYRGYVTRFYRDAAGNTLQIYLDHREGRVVHVLADADNASIGFSARDASGAAALLSWDSDGGDVARRGRERSFEYRLTAATPEVRIGWPLLGSMRVERDFQAWGKHKAPFDAPPFELDEYSRLVAALESLDAPTRTRHLASLGARDLDALKTRLQPTVSTDVRGNRWSSVAVQPLLDGRDTLTLEIRVDPRRVDASRAGMVTTLKAKSGASISFTVKLSTTARALTPLSRQEIFTADFLKYVASVRADSARAGSPSGAQALEGRWLERQVRGVELLASREKLMAGLPTYATYFGRDMMVTALMMRPIWRPEMSAFAIASVLRKLGPRGDVSHEEALGGQAFREASAEYADLVGRATRARQDGNARAADSLVAAAGLVLRNARTTRENYHMIDDEYHLAVLAGRWLTDSRVPTSTRRAFLLARDAAGATRLTSLLKEFALIARNTAGYASSPTVDRLVSFAPRDSGRWASNSWRDSNVGYANGRYAMDINAIWVPHALESIGRILDVLPSLGISLDSIAKSDASLASGAPLGTYVRDRAALSRATASWYDAWKHFVVRLTPADVQSRVRARLEAMPQVERAWWERVLASQHPDRDSLTFLALALDASGSPIGVANSDPATGLFLGEREGETQPLDASGVAAVLRDVRVFTKAYPVGLLIAEVGPVVANDAYATPNVWRDFVRDAYHGPRVAWGREVNLFLLGAASHVGTAGSARVGAAERDAYTQELQASIAAVRRAVEASGFRSELWSYEFPAGRLTPVRYGSGGDVQLWSTTDLVVQYMLSRIAK